MSLVGQAHPRGTCELQTTHYRISTLPPCRRAARIFPRPSFPSRPRHPIPVPAPVIPVAGSRPRQASSRPRHPALVIPSPSSVDRRSKSTSRSPPHHPQRCPPCYATPTLAPACGSGGRGGGGERGGTDLTLRRPAERIARALSARPPTGGRRRRSRRCHPRVDLNREMNHTLVVEDEQDGPKRKAHDERHGGDEPSEVDWRRLGLYLRLFLSMLC